MIEQWREDWRISRMAIAEEFRLQVPEAKMKQVLDGLDVGTIIRYIVPVTLEKHPEHGWVFVCTDGEMFRVSNYIYI
jgi:hypothetical protein